MTALFASRQVHAVLALRTFKAHHQLPALQPGSPRARTPLFMCMGSQPPIHLPLFQEGRGLYTAFRGQDPYSR